MGEEFEVRVSAGSMRADEATFLLPHAWTVGGVAVEGAGTGAHLLHTAVAVCVLNDVFREAGAVDLAIAGVAVTARGAFADDWSSTGVTYEVALDSNEDAARLADLVTRVDEVAEIPRALRAGAEVGRLTSEGRHG